MNVLNVFMPMYQVRYVDDLMHNFDYDNNMIAAALFVGLVCYLLGRMQAYAKWKLHFRRAHGLPTHKVVEHGSNWWLWLHERAARLFGADYKKNEELNKALGSSGWFLTHEMRDKEHVSAVIDFISLCNALGCDVIIRQREDETTPTESDDQHIVIGERDVPSPLVTED